MAPEFIANDHPHTRFNPLLCETILNSPHRTKRPWLGQQEASVDTGLDKYDPKCYLCPGNTRANGEKNDQYQQTFVFENDFSAVKYDNDDKAFFDHLEANKDDTQLVKTAEESDSPFFAKVRTRGKCYVICFSPRHDLTIPQLRPNEFVKVIEAWQKIYCDVSNQYPWVKYIQIFENKGAVMGCSNPHPHCQVWSLDHIPSTAEKFFKAQSSFAKGQHPISPQFEGRSTGAPRLSNGEKSLMLEYAHAELNPVSPRVLIKGDHFVSLVPHWATWPYEVMILPYKKQIPCIASLDESEKADLSDVLIRTTCRLDNLFKCSFPYSMGIYQRPVLNTPGQDFYQFFISLYPPLLRSATVKKFLVGFEMFAEAQRDITPEQAAEKIRSCPERHYTLGA